MSILLTKTDRLRHIPAFFNGGDLRMSKSNRNGLFPAILMLTLTSCASPILRADTADVTSTISDVYTDQTLENLSRFIDNPNTIPSLVDLKDGIVEVTGNFNPSVTIPFGNQVTTTVIGTAGETIQAPSRAFTLGGSVGRKVNWGVSPIVNEGRLRTSIDLFRYAVGVGPQPQTVNHKLCWHWVHADVPEINKEYDLGTHGKHRLSMLKTDYYTNGCLTELVLALMGTAPEKKPGT